MLMMDLHICMYVCTVRELLDFYEFPGEETPIIRGSALAAVEVSCMDDDDDDDNDDGGMGLDDRLMHVGIPTYLHTYTGKR